ncbi:hypothetical protein ACTID9_06750 [Brevibacillus fluminis]|uniref:hypothetical protein n=1 Tax=Brevibacillus fluminis TaxID=511487 RepID=UPI003F8C1754
MNYQNQSPFAQSQMSYQPVSALGSANAIFQPGFAGTNVQEVRQLNSGYAAPALSTGYTATYGTGLSGNIGLGTPVQAIFQPGFANTNVQEVRHLNQGGYLQQQGLGAYGTGIHAGMQTGMQAGMQAPSFPATAQAIFQPGFAGTDVNEVRARNAGGGFIGQNAFAAMHAIPSQGMNTQAYMPVQSFGNTAQAIFQPGFAGTNVAEVRQDYALAQNTQPQPQPYVPYRTF